MAVTTTQTNKPLNPRGNDQSPKGYNRAELYSGKTLDFDGVNDKVTTGNISIQSSNNWSIVLNVQLDNITSGSGYVFDGREGSQDGFGVYHSVGTKGRLNYYDNNANHLTDHVFPIDEYFHLAIIRDGSDVHFYQNGVFVESVESVATYSVTGDFFIGSRYSSSDYLNGKIGGFKAFGVSLTAAQVADLYNNPEKVVPTGVDDSALKLWLPMQEGAGTTAYDGSGNGNHGTISGATYTHGIGAPVSQTAVIDWNKGTNLLKYSEQLNKSTYWGRTNVDVTEDNETAPDGQSTAELIKDTTTTGTHYVNGASSTAASTTYVQSVWVKKKDDGIYAGVRTNGVGTNSYIIFDFDTATIVATGSDIISKGVETYSNGWYRIYMTYTLAPTGVIYSVTNSSSSVIPSYAGTGKGYYIWGAQLEAADALTAYVPNHTGVAITSDVLLPQGLTTGRDITGVNLFENVRKQGALNLDGNSWAEVHKNASLKIGTGDFSVEAWFPYKYSNKGSYANIVIALNDADSIGIKTINGAIQVQDGNGSRNYSSAVENQIYHVVATRTGGTLYMYVDGAFFSSTSTTSPSINATENTAIGADVSAGTARLYSAWIAQPRIYNRALTAEEVQRNYNAGKNIYK